MRSSMMLRSLARPKVIASMGRFRKKQVTGGGAIMSKKKSKVSAGEWKGPGGP